MLKPDEIVTTDGDSVSVVVAGRVEVKAGKLPVEIVALLEDAVPVVLDVMIVLAFAVILKDWHSTRRPSALRRREREKTSGIV